MIRKVTQLELENFAQGTAQAEEAEGGRLLSAADVRAQELAFRQRLVREGKLAEGDELPSWAEAYQNLLNAGVRPRIAAYVAWATMPKPYRYPETQEKLATEFLGLSSDRVISTWRKKFPEIDAMIAELQAEAMLEFRPGAFHALGTVASDPSYRANPDRRLFFEMSNDYTPRQKIMGDEGSGVGRKLLDQLKKLPTAKLLETLGEDAMEIMRELEDELTEDGGQLTVDGEAGDG
ncbi:MAG: hypothetical protein DYG85_06390 [Chloroflexi bacterium CFX1]|nr:conserved hypothetical protein [Virus Rctr41k]MCE7919133.1 hypothetical protein [Chloroflexi bacterium CFX1]